MIFRRFSHEFMHIGRTFGGVLRSTAHRELAVAPHPACRYDEIIMHTSRAAASRLNLDIPVALKRRAKIKAAQRHLTLTQVVSELLTQWVEQPAPVPDRTPLKLGRYALSAPLTLRRTDIYEDFS